MSARRKVRVTLEGTGHQVSEHIMRLQYGDTDNHYVLVDTRQAAVEYLPEPHTWTDGDVVVTTYACALPDIVRTRVDGKWYPPAGCGAAVIGDEPVERRLVLSDPGTEVLRYQAGDQ